MKKHHYKTFLEWTGNEGSGTQSYHSYNRNHVVGVAGKHHGILGSSDPYFLGDKARYNPEELFLSSLSSCHMLWYLHICSVHQVIVTDYVDNATGIMEEDETGSGRFIEVTLNPFVKVLDVAMIDKANQLHEEANKMCFIANSCNFNINHNQVTSTASKPVNHNGKLST